MLTIIENYYSLILSLHILAVFITIGLVLISDLYGLRWVIGNRQTLNLTLLTRLHHAVWFSLFLTMSAGALLAAPYFSYLITTAPFQIKLFLIACLNLNAWLIGKHLLIASTTPFAAVPQPEKLWIIGSGLVSTTGWIGALIAAQFIGI